MKNKNSTKKALISSIMTMILCISMLLGTTLAWFTDTASNTGNRIKAGILEVDLLMDQNKDGDFDPTTESIKDGAGDIYSIAEGGNGLLWEPGKTEIVYLQVKNNGSLALKYNIMLSVNDFGLAGCLEYAILDGVKANDLNGATTWSEITDTKRFANVQKGAFPTGKVVAAPNGKLLADDGQVGGADENCFALAVHMSEKAGNEYQDKELIVDVEVLATQVPEEEDSFGTDYDGAAKDILQGSSENVLKNGDFETISSGKPSNWSGWQDWMKVKQYNGGGSYITGKNTGGSKGVSQIISGVTGGQTFTFTGYVNLVSGLTPNVDIYPRSGGKNVDSARARFELSNVKADGGWTEVSFTYTLPKEYSEFSIYLNFPHTNGKEPATEIYWDYCELVKVASE